jgi:hypothetical protein
MVPTTHYLTEQQIEALKQISNSTGLTVSELIRRAVDALIERNRGG